ncbi:hypothetical protein L3X38_027064 [Prunus dulcis]|uniref:Uncharacterized protein n=1 Tax=Prunus dulcis TaxID=3755 RepID=A0AAD4Z0T1_PRUDU|nr:hypothetical protein L3X38_027064 [Prunus dulcis]
MHGKGEEGQEGEDESEDKLEDYPWLLFDEDLRTNPNMSVVEFRTLVRKYYSIDVTRDQCYKAKNLAKERIQGSIEEQYSKLWDYCDELKRQNPGSTVLVKTSLRGDNLVFERLYIYVLLN